MFISGDKKFPLHKAMGIFLLQRRGFQRNYVVLAPNGAFAPTSSDLRCLILMDGMDLNAILTDRITLDDLLYGKRHHASETGNIYLNVNKTPVT